MSSRTTRAQIHLKNELYGTASGKIEGWPKSGLLVQQGAGAAVWILWSRYGDDVLLLFNRPDKVPLLVTSPV